MDATTLPKGQSKEVSGDGNVNLPGVYQNKDNKELYITADGEEGVIQADYLMNPLWKDAWERIGDVPSRLELMEMRKAQEIKDATEEALAKGKETAELKAAKAKALKEAQVAVE